MKKFLSFLLLTLVLGGLVSAQPAAALNNFVITDFNVQMELGKDADGRSTLATVETITANFPVSDENHGLERAFVKTYDGHSLSLNVESVTDETGAALPHHWNGDNLRIGDADTYVHGLKTYVISYTMRDVTRFFGDTGSDEFYWDVIGGDWQVPITHATVTVKIDPALQEALSGQSACYTGGYGATATCTLKQTEGSFSTEVSNLGPRQGVTVAVGFKEGTFAVYQPSQIEKLIAFWVMLQVVVTPLALLFLVVYLILWYRRLNRSSEIGTIIAEYIPPKDASVTTSAKIGGYNRSIMTAQMLDFAVRHYIKIFEVKEKSFFSPAEYQVEIIRDPSDLREEEQELLKDTFGELPSIGDRINLKDLQNNTEYYKRTLNNDGDLDKLIRGTYQLRELDEGMKKQARRLAGITLILALILFSPTLGIAAIVLFALSFGAWRLTDEGLALKRYLEGLKLYIGVAEKDRIAMLQSPSGAEKVASVVDGDPSKDPKLLITLYERVLPYAVLFGQEKKWNAELGKYYEAANSQPDWYSGHAAFNAIVFTNAMSSFSSANSYASSSSSSSGGSSGGGFSGGGGGGGGGGGW